jgi:hypothetical protein
VILGVGGDDRRFDYYRPILLGLGQPYLLDYAAVMDMELSGMPLPESTRRAALESGNTVWLFPRGSEPFSVSTVYRQGEAAFDEAFREAFQRGFHMSGNTEHFDLWERRATPNATRSESSPE